MKKNDIMVIVALALLFVAWPYIDRNYISKLFPPEPKPADQIEKARQKTPEGPADAAKARGGQETAALRQSAGDEESQTETIVREGTQERIKPQTVQQEEPEAQLPPAKFATMENENIRLIFTSHGGSISRAVLKKYPKTVETNSLPIELTFTNAPSLTYEGVPGFGSNQNFELVESSRNMAIFEKQVADGLKLRREYTLDEGYLLTFNDSWVATGENAVAIENAKIRLGEIQSLPGVSGIRGMEFLGVDSLSRGGEGVKHWGKDMEKLFEKVQDEKGLETLPMSIAIDPWDDRNGVDWIAVKNKFFTEILTPAAVVDGGEVRATRKPTAAEKAGSEVKPNDFEMQGVAAAIVLQNRIVKPGEPVDWSYSCYIGPKKLSALEKLADHKVDIMQLGWLGGISKILLKMLNGIHSIIPNYGLAIIILTFIIKLIFWPITHKGMQGMRRMQEIQPEMNALKEKYKDDKQKQQEEMAKLWKKHKVNPVGGCLPLIVQIPVFIALFTVLRSAIELRFSHFLWIQDLSEPEHLFNLGFSLPLLGEYFNLLPILMAVTMYLQQKMTPTSGDAQQQKMMAIFMPIMIFVMLYNFPSGLILYWTTNQVATIVGQAISRKRHAGEKAPA